MPGGLSHDTASTAASAASRRAPAAASAATATAPAPAFGLAALCDELAGTFAERASVIRALARAFLAGEHAFVLGKPGTGKSALARCFAQALGLSYWEYLMTRYSTPEELFGPLSIPELQKGRFTRNFAGYLPGAQVVFLDEIWKSNSGILNSLLTAHNERVFHDDGKPVRIPLVSMVCASNELPESESELSALYDRCLVRLVTKYVDDRDAFESMLFAPNPTAPTTKVDIVAEQAATRAVTVPATSSMRSSICATACATAGFKVSDRRWKQCVRLIQAAAHLDGRTVAELDDLECLEDVLWRAPEEKTEATRIIQQVANPSGLKAVELLDQAKELVAQLPAIDDKVPASKAAFLGKVASVNGDLKAIAGQLSKLPVSRKVTSCVAEVEALRRSTSQAAAKAAGII